MSFAGENRELVRNVVGSLKRRHVTCFYDLDEQATLLGKNLFTYLNEVYRKKARFCIMFISEHYPLKQWTNRERQSIQARMFESTDEYLITVGTRSVTWTHMTILRKLRKALTDPIALALLDLTAARPGQRVPFSEVLKSAGGSDAASGRIALGVLSKTIKREFNLPPEKVTWPVEKIAGTAGSSETQYLMPPEVAEAWRKTAA